eukprot:6348768-Amphidinium_carterae.3
MALALRRPMSSVVRDKSRSLACWHSGACTDTRHACKQNHGQYRFTAVIGPCKGEESIRDDPGHVPVLYLAF